MDGVKVCLFAGWMVSVGVGCAPADTNETGGTTTETTSPGSDKLDARVPLPDTDPAYYDVISPEFEIAVGEDKMLCYHIEIGQEMTIDNLETYQGKFGHHIVLLTAKEPLPPGTVEDCTDRKAMTKYGTFALPDTPLSAGYGLAISKGQRAVMQIHYINAGSQPEIIRDVARLHMISKDSVTKWVQTMAGADNTLSLPPQQKSSLHFDCDIPANTELLVIGGHMHERGTQLEVQMGPDEASLKSAYLVDPWKSEFRDSPPVSLFFQKPMVFAEQNIMRVTCEWNNASPDTVIFPDEMCATFGYVAGTDAPINCQVNPQ